MDAKDKTTTMSFRAPEPIANTVRQVAKNAGLSSSVWLLQVVLAALNDVTDDELPAREESTSAAGVPPSAEKLHQAESQWNSKLDQLQALIHKANAERREDMATLAQLKLNAEKATQTLVLDAGAELLLAIERLKQSQRSHKDTLLQAIDDLNATGNSQRFPHAG